MCLASWKDGSDMFFYASVSSPVLEDEDGKYRCFVSDRIIQWIRGYVIFWRALVSFLIFFS